MYATSKYLKNCIFQCGNTGNCSNHDPNFVFGIVCMKHFANIYEIGHYGFVREKPKSKVYDGPYVAVAPRCEMPQNRVIIPYRTKVDETLPILNSSRFATSNSRDKQIADSPESYFGCEPYLDNHPDLKMYQIEVYRNITQTTKDGIEISEVFASKKEALAEAVRSTWANVETLYRNLPHVVNYFNYVDHVGPQLSPFEKLILFYCNIGGCNSAGQDVVYTRNLLGYNVKIVNEIGWVATELIQHGTILFLRGFVPDDVQTSKELKFQRVSIENYKCGNERAIYSKIPYHNCSLPKETLCGIKY